jgi:hypothetical protein
MFRGAIAAVFLTGPAWADGFAVVSDPAAFDAQVVGREIVNRVLGINLVVQPDGTISGKAVTWPVTGTWSWQDGFFCRELDWSGMAIPYNCQLVEIRGDQVRFTVDRGDGDAAEFRLR